MGKGTAAFVDWTPLVFGLETLSVFPSAGHQTNIGLVDLHYCKPGSDQGRALVRNSRRDRGMCHTYPAARSTVPQPLLAASGSKMLVPVTGDRATDRQVTTLFYHYARTSRFTVLIQSSHWGSRRICRRRASSATSRYMGITCNSATFSWTSGTITSGS